MGRSPQKTNETVIGNAEKITKEELEREYPDGIPPEYDPEQVPNLSRHQVVFFDEMYMEQENFPI